MQNALQADGNGHRSTAALTAAEPADQDVAPLRARASAAADPFSAPWPGGAELAAALRPEVPKLIGEMIAAIGAEVPEYDRPLQGTFGENVRRGTAAAIERFLALIAGELSGEPGQRAIYVELGRSELRAGRALESLLTAYRVGARVTWRSFADAGLEAGIEPKQLFRLAEALFAYIDELSAESADGYSQERALQAGRRELEREHLVELLTRDPAPAAATLQTQAMRAGWTLPELLTPVALAATGAAAPAMLQRRLPDDFLTVAHAGFTLILTRDLQGPGRMKQLKAALRGAAAVTGPTAGLADAAEAIDRTLLAARLQQDAILPANGVVMADEHLVTLILHRDPRRARALSEHALRPLQALAEGQRKRLSQTLAAWLDNACSTTEAAKALHIHPQTLRYRLRHLQDALGSERLASADGRLELALALRAGRLVEAPAPPSEAAPRG